MKPPGSTLDHTALLIADVDLRPWLAGIRMIDGATRSDDPPALLFDLHVSYICGIPDRHNAKDERSRPKDVGMKQRS